MKIIISGGGTGGHIYPAIAIADALKKREPLIDILFVGAEGKMEMEKVPQAGYPIKGLWISGFQRRLTLQNLLFPVKVMHSLIKCRQIVKAFKPDVVVGVGGYASGPLVKVAAEMNIPSALQEQNSFPGVTNRMLAKTAEKIFVAYPGMQKYFPAEKIFYTGNPMRGQLAMDISKEDAAAYFGLDAGKKTILAFGGSLGARTINEIIQQSHDLIRDRHDIQVLWQIGKFYAEKYLSSPVASLENVKATVFIDRMDYAYTLADIVIARAGAITISELCLVGKPVILIPSPNVTGDHQTHNAKALVNNEAAVLIHDAEAPKKAIKEALRLLGDHDEMSKLEHNIRAFGKPFAADEIADHIIQLANSKQN